MLKELIEKKLLLEKDIDDQTASIIFTVRRIDNNRYQLENDI